MRSLLMIIDGLGDDSFAAWQGRTPFEKAVHLNMDKLLEQGSLQELSICEDDLAPESCSCILRLLGVAKEAMPQNRAYLELLAKNSENELQVTNTNTFVKALSLWKTTPIKRLMKYTYFHFFVPFETKCHILFQDKTITNLCTNIVLLNL